MYRPLKLLSGCWVLFLLPWSAMQVQTSNGQGGIHTSQTEILIAEVLPYFRFHSFQLQFANPSPYNFCYAVYISLTVMSCSLGNTRFFSLVRTKFSLTIIETKKKPTLPSCQKVQFSLRYGWINNSSRYQHLYVHLKNLLKGNSSAKTIRPHPLSPRTLAKFSLDKFSD